MYHYLKQQIAKKNLILKVKAGSFLYGTNTENSDNDFVGVFMPTQDMLYGIQYFDEIDLSKQVKLDNGKNSKESIDYKVYEFKNFCRLAMKCNPNILEILFADRFVDADKYNHRYGYFLQQHRDLFLSKEIYHRFAGYANSQKNKMYIKKMNYLDLKSGITFLNDIDNKKMLLTYCEKYNDFKNLFTYKNKSDKHYKVGDINIVKNQTIKKAISILETRIKNKTNRIDLIESKGYDYKYASHVVRLLYEGIELLLTNNLIFPLKKSKVIKEIKLGLWNFSRVIKLIERLECGLSCAYSKSNLPKKCNYENINKFVISFIERYYFGEL